MANMLFTNNAATTLASSINNSVTSLTVATGGGALFPNPGAGQYFYCTLANTAGTVEIIKVTARSGDTFSTIIRGQDGTSATSWNSGDKVELRLVNADLTNFPQLDSDNTFAGTQTFSNTITGSISGNAGTATTAADLSATLAVNKGGTGQTTYTNGQLLIGNTTGNTLTKATLTAGTGISVTNGTGSITITNSSPGSTVYRTRVLRSGTTYTPEAKVKSFYAFVYGSTGGRISSNNVQGGEGGPAYSETYYTSPSGTYTYSIGAAGAAGGGTGGTTTFGAMSVPGTTGLPSLSSTGRAGAVATGGTFNASGGTGGNASAGAQGGGGGAGSRAGNGGNGGNAPSNSLAGGGGGTGGNNASGNTGGAAATVKAAGALDLSTTLAPVYQTWTAGVTPTSTTGGRGADQSTTTDLSYIWATNDNRTGTGTSGTAGVAGLVVVIELL